MKRLGLAWLGLSLLGCSIFAGPGLPCRKHEDCSGLKDGYCSKAEICTRECSENIPCPGNSACSAQGKRNVCLPKCEVDADCLKSFACSMSVCVLRAPLDPPAQ